MPGIFAAGNVLHVHDLVDFVSLEAEALADSAAEYLLAGSLPACPLAVAAGANVGHVIPQRISAARDFTLSLRVRKPMQNVSIVVRQGRHGNPAQKNAQGIAGRNDPAAD